MRILPAALIALSALTLAACQTSSLTQEEQAPVPESKLAFSGEAKQIDKTQSVISFTGKSNIINHEGKFNVYNADVVLDETDPADLTKAKVAAQVDLTSVEVDAPGLQGHLAKADFFDVENHPSATFTSTKIEHIQENVYDITGDLTIKGVTKEVTINAEITDDYLTAVYDLPRQEFGIGNDSYGEKLLEPTVPVTIKLVFQQ